jgi:hypothetical protein
MTPIKSEHEQTADFDFSIFDDSQESRISFHLPKTKPTFVDTLASLIYNDAKADQEKSQVSPIQGIFKHSFGTSPLFVDEINPKDIAYCLELAVKPFMGKIKINTSNLQKLQANISSELQRIRGDYETQAIIYPDETPMPDIVATPLEYRLAAKTYENMLARLNKQLGTNFNPLDLPIQDLTDFTRILSLPYLQAHNLFDVSVIPNNTMNDEERRANSIPLQEIIFQGFVGAKNNVRSFSLEQYTQLPQKRKEQISTFIEDKRELDEKYNPNLKSKEIQKDVWTELSIWPDLELSELVYERSKKEENDYVDSLICSTLHGYVYRPDLAQNGIKSGLVLVDPTGKRRNTPQTSRLEQRNSDKPEIQHILANENDVKNTGFVGEFDKDDDCAQILNSKDIDESERIYLDDSDVVSLFKRTIPSKDAISQANQKRKINIGDFVVVKTDDYRYTKPGSFGTAIAPRGRKVDVRWDFLTTNSEYRDWEIDNVDVVLNDPLNIVSVYRQDDEVYTPLGRHRIGEITQDAILTKDGNHNIPIKDIAFVTKPLDFDQRIEGKSKETILHFQTLDEIIEKTKTVIQKQTELTEKDTREAQQIKLELKASDDLTKSGLTRPVADFLLYRNGAKTRESKLLHELAQAHTDPVIHYLPLSAEIKQRFGLHLFLPQGITEEDYFTYLELIKDYLYVRTFDTNLKRNPVVALQYAPHEDRLKNSDARILNIAIPYGLGEACGEQYHISFNGRQSHLSPDELVVLKKFANYNFDNSSVIIEDNDEKYWTRDYTDKRKKNFSTGGLYTIVGRHSINGVQTDLFKVKTDKLAENWSEEIVSQYGLASQDEPVGLFSEAELSFLETSVYSNEIETFVKEYTKDFRLKRAHAIELFESAEYELRGFYTGDQLRKLVEEKIREKQ